MGNGNSIDALLDSLTLDEQVSLLAGSDFWHTMPVERVGIPAVRVTDGPAGARGTSWDGPASVNVPCSTALAASWDPALVEEIGHLLGLEVRAKGARVHLAPTVNLHRTPIGGRNIECMSEDPYLTARIAVAYVRGVQAEGVASCIKHFVGNDTEFERNSIDSRVDERTLRELYLVPFEAAVREAGVMSVMTAYNRINGPFAADSRDLIHGVLRGEWGFDGLVMSDWMGLHSTAPGVHAGLDLEMPGPTAHRGRKLVDAVGRGDVSAADVRAAARNVLLLADRLGAFDDGAPGPETTRDEPTDRALVRRAGAAGRVLLRNDVVDGAPVLPLGRDGLRRVAVIGPNAAVGQVMGGGSAFVRPVHVSHPLDALTARLGGDGGVEVVHRQGCTIHKRLPALDPAWSTPVEVSYFADPDDAGRPDAVAAKTRTMPTSRLIWFTDPLDHASHEPCFGAVIRSILTPPVNGPWQLSISSVGDAQLFVDGTLVLDNSAVGVGGSFFGLGKGELIGTVDLVAGQSYALVVQLRRHRSENGLSGLNIGAFAPENVDLLSDAADAAHSADVAIVVVGTNDDWESEGWDRDDIGLPGRQDELIAAVADVCPRTIVVVNAGSPVSMPWLDRVAAVVYAWFPGQEFGDALVDVLLGDVEPQGRLPVTFPRRIEDTPAGEHHPGRNGVANYAERRLMGYRWYDTVGREPLFAFGHGLGYASPAIVAARAVDAHTVEVDLTNTSERDGVEVVQVYVHAIESNSGDGDAGEVAIDEPAQRLVGFAKVGVPASGRSTTTVRLDPRTYQSWSTTDHGWVDNAGAFELRVGRSSRDIAVHLPVSR